MRTIATVLAGAALVSVVLFAPAGAQTTNRWLPRIGDLFGSKKSNDADKKSKAPPQKAKSDAPPRITINRVAPPPDDEPIVTVEERSTRLMEILVELALAADPVTFPYLLEARVEGQSMKLRGTVGSKAVREHAVKLVRLNCPLTVVDAMKEHAGTAPKKTGSPDTRTLEKSATSALKAAFAKEGGTFDVKCEPDGRTEVVGFVRSFEDKLKVCQTLRRVHGCTAVSNLVHVLAENSAVTSVPGGEPANRPVSNPATRTKSPPRPLPANTSEDPTLPPVPKVSSGDPADIDILPILERLSEQPVKMTKSLKDFRGAPEPRSAKLTTKQPTKPPQTAAQRPVAKPTQEVVAAKPAAKPGPVAASSPPQPSSAVQAARFSTAAPAAPVITPTTATPIPFQAPSATSQERALPASPAPLKSADGSVQMMPGVAASLPGQLKAIVEKSCGPSVRDVYVEVLSPTDIIVQFKVPNENEGRQLARRLLTVPELQRYRVEVRVKVPQ